VFRGNWFVENKLHWQLDVSFNEDQSRLRSDYAAENFSMMNKVALNLKSKTPQQVFS
jgi:predicted transposase YbfD/YdcC